MRGVASAGEFFVGFILTTDFAIMSLWTASVTLFLFWHGIPLPFSGAVYDSINFFHIKEEPCHKKRSKAF